MQPSPQEIFNQARGPREKPERGPWVLELNNPVLVAKIDVRTLAKAAAELFHEGRILVIRNSPGCEQDAAPIDPPGFLPKCPHGDWVHPRVSGLFAGSGLQTLKAGGRSTYFAGMKDTLAVVEVKRPSIDDILAQFQFENQVLARALAMEEPRLKRQAWALFRKQSASQIEALPREDYARIMVFVEAVWAGLRERGLLYEHWWRPRDAVLHSSTGFHGRGQGDSVIGQDSVMEAGRPTELYVVDF